LAALAGALVALRQTQSGDASVAESAAPREVTAAVEAATAREDSTPERAAPARREQAEVGEPPRVARAGAAARDSKRSRRRPAPLKSPAGSRVEVAAAAQAPGEAERLEAKEQLVYALRLTSVKLGEVRRKVHGGGDESRPAADGRGRTR
ncbi:MAG TPA: hypothetical protein VN228_07315, partial [Pyrinomonadaceae bacterium]|nr:hypothetical protein [Pyrinomonadaceae bacterium]